MYTTVSEKNPIDPQPVSKTLVMLAENSLLKFLQHSMNLIFFCNHRLFVTVLWTDSLVENPWQDPAKSFRILEKVLGSCAGS